MLKNKNDNLYILAYEIWRWFKNIIEAKDYILLTESVKYLEVKIHTNLVDNIILMMFPWNSIELKLSSSKE